MILPRRGSDRVPDSVVLVIFVVAASLGTVFAKDTAFVEVVLFESSPNGDYTTYTTGLQGRFSKAGATISAEGEIVQVSLFRSLYQGGGRSRESPGYATRTRGVISPSCPSSNFFHRGCVCVGVCAGSVRRACKHMRSQDGSYLVEFIHRENMLLQVILLMSGAHWCTRYSLIAFTQKDAETFC